MDLLNFPIIILAAGASRRMQGRDKLMEVIDGHPLLRLQAEKALAATNGPVLVALPPAPHPRYAALDGLPVTPVPVAAAAEGMGASLRTAMASLDPGTTAAMLLLPDLPDITAEDLLKVGRAVDLAKETQIWRGATDSGKPGHPIVFHASLFDAFADLTGDTGGQEIVAKAKGRIALIALDGTRARNDLDTPEAWAAWRAANNK